MAAWMIWVGIGVICLIIEIFTPGFLFMSFGVGAIITGLISIAGLPFWAEILVFIVVTFIIFLNLRKLSKKLLNNDYQSNVNALIGKKAVVTEKISKTTRGYVKVGGETWSAVSENDQEIAAAENVKIIKVEGNKLIVKVNEE